MQIRVRFQQTIFPNITVPTKVTTLHDLKQLILNQGFIPNIYTDTIDYMTIVVRTRICLDAKASLISYGITDNTLVHCIFPPSFFPPQSLKSSLKSTKPPPKEKIEFQFPTLDDTPIQPTPTVPKNQTDLHAQNITQSPTPPRKQDHYVLNPHVITPSPIDLHDVTPKGRNSQHFLQLDQEAVSRLVHKGYPERAVINTLLISGGQENIAEVLLNSGYFADEESNQKLENLLNDRTLTTDQRRGLIYEMLSQFARINNPDASNEQLQQIESTLRNSFDMVRNVTAAHPEIMQYSPFANPALAGPQYNSLMNNSPYQQIDSLYSHLNRHETNLISDLTNVLLHKSSENPFAMYLQKIDSSEFEDQVYDDFVRASSFDGESAEISFIADALLNYRQTLNTALFLLDASDNDSTSAYVLLRS